MTTTECPDVVVTYLKYGLRLQEGLGSQLPVDNFYNREIVL